MFLNFCPLIIISTKQIPNFTLEATRSSILSRLSLSHFSKLLQPSTTTMSRHPILKWAQRDDLVFITVELPDAKDVKLKLEPEGKFYFSATSGPDNIPYEIDINLFDKVDVKESKASVGLRNILYLVKKEETKWWSRLVKQEGKTPLFIKVDWNKWVDEDEQDENAEPDMAFDDVNFSSLNIGGGGEEDYEDEDESDTEEETGSMEDATVNGELGVSSNQVEVKS